ncbi:MAG: magnesium transporter [Bdellovibrionaceae bacterium]|nr:magnesium transporter [Pseudobdellovibrionaceae bacterium]
MEASISLLVNSIQKLYHRKALENIQKIFAKTHYADIAEILSHFSSEERIALFNLLSSGKDKSSVLSYLSETMQKEILEALSKKEVLNVVTGMDSDDVADLLATLPEESVKEILTSMEKSDSTEVVNLISYPEDSAGGLMNSDFLAFDQNFTVQQAIDFIQSEESESLITFYIYVVADEDKLIGVLNLKQLLLAKKKDILKDLMKLDVISVSVETNQEQVARVVEKYDFLSVPVVDPSGSLVGVITVDDVLDVIREEAEEELLHRGQAGGGMESSLLEHFKARLPWVLLTFLGGLLCFSIVHLFTAEYRKDAFIDFWLLITASLPLILSLGSVLSTQSATMTLSGIRVGIFEKKNIWLKHFAKELCLGLFFSILLFLLLFVVSYFFPIKPVYEILVLGIVFQVFLSLSLGSFVPLVFEKLGLNATVSALPFLTILLDIIIISLLFYYLSFS